MKSDNQLRRHTVQVEEAQRMIGMHTRPLDVEEIPLDQAYGRTLAEEAAASQPLPHFRRSGMDGFAVKVSDLSHATPQEPVRLEVIETIPCGSVPSRILGPGQASRIMTGAMLPEGADAVIMFEMVEDGLQEGAPYISIKKPVIAGDNVSEIGSELAEGTILLEQGRKITAGETSLLAAFGHSRVMVYRAPRIAILSTGSELLEISEPIAMGKIRNSNAYMLAHLVREFGGIPIMLGTAPDDLEKLSATIEQAAAQADAIVTTGGVSVGDYDVLAHYLTHWDGQLLFNKVAMRPGSPTSAGVKNGQFLFALSGNPGACYVGFHLFVKPVMVGMQGGSSSAQRIRAILAEEFPKVNAYTRYVRGKVAFEDGRVVASPVGTDKSSIMTSIKDSNCLIIVPPGGSGMKAGERVDVQLLREWR